MVTNCIKCSILLTDETWTPECKRNYVYKCRPCINLEKREYHRQWHKNHKELSVQRSLEFKRRLRKERPIEARARDARSDSRKRSIRLGMEFDLTTKFVSELFHGATVCPYFGWQLTFSGKDKTLASLDRIDSSRGYTMDNVRVISYLANLMKSSASEEEMLRFARGVIREHPFLRSVEKVNGINSGH